MDKLLKFYINGEWVDPLSTDKMPGLIRLGTAGGRGGVGQRCRRRLGGSRRRPPLSTTVKPAKTDRLCPVGSERTERRFEELAQAMWLEMGAPITMARDARPTRRSGISMVLLPRWKPRSRSGLPMGGAPGADRGMD